MRAASFVGGHLGSACRAVRCSYVQLAFMQLGGSNGSHPRTPQHSKPHPPSLISQGRSGFCQHVTPEPRWLADLGHRLDRAQACQAPVKQSGLQGNGRVVRRRLTVCCVGGCGCRLAWKCKVWGLGFGLAANLGPETFTPAGEKMRRGPVMRLRL